MHFDFIFELTTSKQYIPIHKSYFLFGYEKLHEVEVLKHNSVKKKYNSFIAYLSFGIEISMYGLLLEFNECKKCWLGNDI